MKKILIIITMLLGVYKLTAQVLYTDNFDNHSVGNLGTDPTGQVSGQWGWLTYSQNTQSNSFFTIVNETGRGKVLDISTGLTSSEGFMAVKTNLSSLINNRNSGNNVLMFEMDFYTGPKHVVNGGGGIAGIKLYSIGDPYSLTDPPEDLADTWLFKQNGRVYTGSSNKQDAFLPFNTWVKLIFYLDYTNKKVYYYIPSLNRVSVSDFLEYVTSANLIQEYPISNIVLDMNVSNGANDPKIYTRNRYDNIKITAINAVPPNIIALSTSEQLATKFNLYPNPATSVVNITNTENMVVNQVTIYDVAGKQLSTQNFNNEAEIQLNVENLASGTYMLHLQTKQGTAVKKLLKK